MENSSRYFKNRKCQYYPCHTGMQGADFNCLFCYCPMNRYQDCPGTPVYITGKGGTQMKDCSACTYPHEPENYESILEFLKTKQ